MIAVAPTQSSIQVALRAFLLAILPAGTEVIEGQDNRVPEPSEGDFVVFTPILRGRLSTNVDGSADAAFTGSIAGPTLTITAVHQGALAVGSVIFGVGVAANTTVTAFGTGSGGIGTYTVTPSQTVGSELLAAGASDVLQPTMVTVQLDVHGPASADNAQIISTLLRDDFAVEQFKTSGFDVTPLYADDPRQVPFINENQQFENRYVVDAQLQANQVVIVPLQFMDAVDVGVVSVEATYPA